MEVSDNDKAIFVTLSSASKHRNFQYNIQLVTRIFYFICHLLNLSPRRVSAKHCVRSGIKVHYKNTDTKCLPLITFSNRWLRADGNLNYNNKPRLGTRRNLKLTNQEKLRRDSRVSSAKLFNLFISPGSHLVSTLDCLCQCCRSPRHRLHSFNFCFS